MHGRKKVSIDEAKQIQRRQKAKNLSELYSLAIDALKSDELLIPFLQKKSCTLLEYLDDFSTLWNKRKVFFGKELNSAEELQITEHVLAKNPKSYYAWHHRRYVISKTPNFDFSTELKRCDSFLQSDSRNFHCWRHRRWAFQKNLEINSEIVETTSQIEEKNEKNVEEGEKNAEENKQNVEENKQNTEENKQNTEENKQNVEENKQNVEENKQNTEENKQNAEEGEKNVEENKQNTEEGEKNVEENKQKTEVNKKNAEPVKKVPVIITPEQEIEFTSKLIVQETSNFSAWHYRSQFPQDIKKEIEFVNNAIWTEPNDQGPWTYYRFLIMQCDQQILSEQLENIESLIEMEPNCRYPYLAAIWIIRKMEVIDSEKINQMKEHLKTLDPIRAVYYEEQ